MTKVKPLGNRILIERSKAQTTKGGILLPDSAQEKPREGIVVEVGPGKVDDQGNLQSLNVKVGDRILFGAYSGTEVKNVTPNSDKEYLIMSEDEVFGIIS